MCVCVFFSLCSWSEPNQPLPLWPLTSDLSLHPAVPWPAGGVEGPAVAACSCRRRCCASRFSTCLNWDMRVTQEVWSWWANVNPKQRQRLIFPACLSFSPFASCLQSSRRLDDETLSHVNTANVAAETLESSVSTWTHHKKQPGKLVFHFLLCFPACDCFTLVFFIVNRSGSSSSAVYSNELVYIVSISK